MTSSYVSSLTSCHITNQDNFEVAICVGREKALKLGMRYEDRGKMESECTITIFRMISMSVINPTSEVERKSWT